MKTKNYFILAAAAFALASCSNDDEIVANGPVAAKVTASIDGPQTRAVGTTWEANDQIGISCTTGSQTYSNVLYTVDNTTNGSFTNTTNPIYFQNLDEVTFSAYYPYAATLTNGKIEKTIAADDQATAAQKQIDYMFATGAKASKANPEVKFIDGTPDARFKHSMSKLTFVFKQGSDTDLKNMTNFTVKGLKMAGEFNTADGVAATTTTATAADLTIAEVPGASDTYTRSLILFPQTLTDSKFNLELTLGGVVYKAELTLAALAAGNEYTFNITVNKTAINVSQATIVGWNDGGSNNGEATM